MTAEQQIAVLRELQSKTDLDAFALIVKMAQEYCKLYPAKPKLRLVAIRNY